LAEEGEKYCLIAFQYSSEELKHYAIVFNKFKYQYRILDQ